MLKIRYEYTAAAVHAGQLSGLRSEWKRRPAAALTLASLRNMNAVVLAIDEADRVVGFACGMTDGLLVLYVWDVEVLPDARGEGIEAELLRRMLERFGQVYQVNAHPADSQAGLFARAGFTPYPPDQARAMTVTRPEWQDGGAAADRL